MGKRRGARDPVNVLFGWVRQQSMRVKVFLGVIAALATLVLFYFLDEGRIYFFILSETVHAMGIFILCYKLTLRKTCSGLSLKSQELTALFLLVRLYCSLVLEKDIHTIIDFTTFVATLWVIYMMRFKLKSTYAEELDSVPRYYLVVPTLGLAMFIHPNISHTRVWNSMAWAFCVYLESISVLPQLRMMQNAKMVEPFTAHYVFALGLARFLTCAHWIVQIFETGTNFFIYLGSGIIWRPAMLIAEIIQTFILADFCYYYVKSCMLGELLVRLPSPV